MIKFTLGLLFVFVMVSCGTSKRHYTNLKLPMAADGIVRLSKIEVYSQHLQKYKQGTLHMVKTLVLSDQMPLNPANRINNFIQERV